ncbi:hypothetical protein GN157_07035 [Flavobacterium rakeshii]|uniref:Uncharacterized protein n=1 Tax=Flavobacterium rakeshii TaxID=1038845 RepID=A0A6N8H9Y5_9FLAO|nr:hypothetical protein [Flavobacterium rakeshii]MUV03459.1 hypothetical protein [Flavobacterium rakeshii]
MTFTLQFRLFIYLVLGFIAATVIGTVTHECGHIAVAKMLGYKTKLHYASMNTLEREKDKEFEQFYEDNKEKILSPSPLYAEEKAAFNEYMHEEQSKSMLIFTGGPIQTMLTGTIGFLLLWFNRKNIGDKLTLLQWIFVLLTFFWSRQIFNMLTGTVLYFKRGKWVITGDEAILSYHYNLPTETINAVTAIIATVILLITVFKLIPKQQRLTFITSGIIGATIGGLLWLKYLGPIILP